MVKKPFLFPQLAKFLHNPILHYGDSLWLKKQRQKQYIASRTMTLNCFITIIVWGYTEIFLLLMILISFYVTK